MYESYARELRCDSYLRELGLGETGESGLTHLEGLTHGEPCLGEGTLGVGLGALLEQHNMATCYFLKE